MAQTGRVRQVERRMAAARPPTQKVKFVVVYGDHGRPDDPDAFVVRVVRTPMRLSGPTPTAVDQGDRGPVPVDVAGLSDDELAAEVDRLDRELNALKGRTDG